MPLQENITIKEISQLSKDQFSALYQVSRLLNAAKQQDTLISDALDTVIQILNAERGLFAKYHLNLQKISIIAARNFEHKDISDVSEFSSGILKPGFRRLVQAWL